MTRNCLFVKVLLMLRIRLQRVGRKNDPSFRVVLTDRLNSTKSGRVLEVLGNYDARSNKRVIDAEKVKRWISVGAQPTDTVHNLLISEKIIEGKKINVLPKKTPPAKAEEPKVEEKKEEAVTSEAPAVEASTEGAPAEPVAEAEVEGEKEAVTA